MPLTAEEDAAVAGESAVSCCTRVAVPPPTAAAAMATAAIRPTPRRARRWGTGEAVGAGPAVAYEGPAGGGAYPPPDPDGHTVVPGSVLIGRVGS
ncbi:hypothetical protein GCM10010363_68760 [Streptomyces omiyaensis]|nr:hypothetical protein GCM10010363_68760 [Streptomyces omiyaensis]